MSIIYKNRTRSKDNVNNNFVRALDSGTSTISGSTLTASNLTANLPVKTDANKILVSSQISVSDLDFVPLTNPLSAEMVADGFNSTGTNEVKTRFLQDNGGGLFGVECKSIFKTPLGLRTTSIRHTTPGSDVRLDDNIDCNNKQLRDCNSIATSTLSTQAGLGGQITVVGGPINLNTNSLTNVNDISTTTISAKNGVSISLLDDFDVNNYDLLNCANVKVANIEGIGASDITVSSNIDLNNNDLLDVGNINVSTINNITPVGGLYCGISDGVVINQASGQTDLLPVSSVGSLVIPANGFKIGDSFHLVVAGIFPTESKNDDITIEIKQNGTTIASINLELEDFDTEPSNFELEMDFVIRSIGITGSVVSNLDFSFNKKISKDFKGTRSTNITTINTTTASILSVLATVNGATSSIQSSLAYLRKQY
jgi:hypothetical protein